MSYALVGRGGDAIQVQELAEAFRRAGHDVFFLGPQAIRPYEFTRAAGRLRDALRKLPWWARDSIELALNVITSRKAKSLLSRQGFDLIFHRAGIYDLIGVQLASQSSCPLIAHLDAPYPLERAFRGDGYFHTLHRNAMTQLGRAARLVVTVSSASREYYQKLGLPAEKLFVIPNGISERLLKKGAELALSHPPLQDTESCTLGFIGSMSRWHRLDLLLEALSEINTQANRRFRLLVVGYGEEYGNLQALGKELGLEGQIRWLGPLPHERAFEAIAQFDIAVLPHTLTTGAPLKLFEYAALARPTIVPDLPNLRELFNDHEMEFIEPESPQSLMKAVLRLTDCPEAATRLGKRAQTRVQQYTWEQAVDQLLQVLYTSTD